MRRNLEDFFYPYPSVPLRTSVRMVGQVGQVGQVGRVDSGVQQTKTDKITTVRIGPYPALPVAGGTR